jgi:cell division protein FtsB
MSEGGGKEYWATIARRKEQKLRLEVLTKENTELRTENERLLEFLLSSGHGQEYERLRAENAALSKEVEFLRDQRAVAIEYRAEVERLQKELGECQAGWETGSKAIARIAELEGALEKITMLSGRDAREIARAALTGSVAKPEPE